MSKLVLLLGTLESSFPDEVALIREKILAMEDAALAANPMAVRQQALQAGIKSRIEILAMVSEYNPLKSVSDVVDKVTRAKRAGVLSDRDAAKITRSAAAQLGEASQGSPMDAFEAAFPTALREIMNCIATLEEEAWTTKPKGAVLQSLAGGVKSRLLMLKAASKHDPAKSVMDSVDQVTRAKRAGNISAKDAEKIAKNLGKAI